MSMVAFDTLKLARRLREAGMPPEQAEAVADAEAEALGEFVLANLATKTDIAEVKADISEVKAGIEELRVATKADISEVKADIEALRATTKADIEALRVDTKAEINELRLTVKADHARLEGQMEALEERMKGLEGRMDHMATKADLIALEKKFTVYFLVLMFTVIFLNQNALEFIARLLGLVH